MASSRFWGVPTRVTAVATNPTDSDVSTAETIQHMIALARSAATSPLICSVVDGCIKTLPKTPTQRDLARAIYWKVKNKLTFCEDESIIANQLGMKDINQELLIHPVVLWQMPTPMGDCDDYATLIASLLCCANIRCAFVTIAADADMPWKFSHVYVTAWLDDEKQQIGMDASHGDNLGWEYKNATRRHEWLVN